MKKFIERVIVWFKESNRYKHAIAGLIIFICAIIFNNILDIERFANLTNALVVTVIAMIIAEYKDNLWNGKFDLCDIAAGMIPVCIIYVTCVLLYNIN